MQYVNVLAHRGASGYAPENTMTAFLLAKRLGADGIELDVHLTADGVVVVCHDSDVARTTNGEGIIEKMTYAELLELDFGYPDMFGKKFEDTKISTLEEVLDAFIPAGMIVNVELKATSEGIVEKVLAIEEKYRATGLVLFSSFKHDYLRELKRLSPDSAVAPLYWTDDDFVNTGTSLGAVALHPAWNCLTEAEDYCKKAHEAGLKVHPYTPNKPSDLEALMRLGADAVITNYPDRAIDIRTKLLRRM